MSKPKPPNVEIITEPSRLAELCEAVRACGWCAFDTEFVGEDQFRPELCLMQIAYADGCVLVDPLSGVDVSPVWELIAGDDVLVIVHSGSEDIAQCRQQVDKAPQRVFDLQIAAGFVGMDFPISLSRLAASTSGEKIHKSQTLSNWRQRPLTGDQIRYAVEDVIHLRPIYDLISARLDKLKRTDWLWEECDALCRAAAVPEEEVQKLKRLRGAGSLQGRDLAVAHALIEEREKIARQYNRPARVLLKDHLLVEIARRGWTDAKKMQTLRGINLGMPALQQLAQAVQRGLKMPSQDWPQLPSNEDSPQEQMLISLLTAVLLDYCTVHQLAYGLLSKKQSLRSFIRAHTRPEEAVSDHPLAMGWRKAAVGELLERLMTGERIIRLVSPQAGRFQLETR